ncbi:glycerol kinase GlpK [Rheinheimera sp. 4Y26]|uniref:glycerol kinase GlpK n=1 Tax=Rheinheimera sp. 4Y26 TaxID=2977811 RepID=UPI0021B0976B|nr:glycerol kinase GlpK [Rheinheimera sp. 4Y26]MCT6698495.1 glycerol kinase GlpK [Rheinheimera sp. 4Y26]
MQQVMLALDQGTSSSRALLFNQQGQVLAQAQQELNCQYPQQGWVEQDAEHIWLSVLKVCRDVLKQAQQQQLQVVGIGISNQRETTVAWHKTTGEVLAPAIVWQDRRTGAYCADLKAQGHAAMVRQKTGLELDPYFSASKINWLLQNQQAVAEAAAASELCVGTIDAFLVWRLTGGAVFATDTSNASRTMLFNIQSLQWDQELLNLFQVPADCLPVVKQSADFYGDCLDTVFGKTLPVLALAGDQQAAAIGQGCVSAGSLKSTYGTGCFALLNTGEQPLYSSNNLLTTVACTVQGQTLYALEGAIFVAGAAVKWLRDQLGVIQCASETEALAAGLLDNGGVYLVPAFTGLAAPHWRSDVRAAVLGMTFGTGKAQLARAALEAVVYQTADLLAAMQADGARISALKVDGGMVVNNWFCQYLADLLNLPVLRPATTESSAYGVALLAGISFGWYPDLAATAQRSDPEQRFEPRMGEAQRAALLKGWHQAVAQVLAC